MEPTPIPAPPHPTPIISPPHPTPSPLSCCSITIKNANSNLTHVIHATYNVYTCIDLDVHIYLEVLIRLNIQIHIIILIYVGTQDLLIYVGTQGLLIYVGTQDLRIKCESSFDGTLVASVCMQVLFFPELQN